MRGIITTEYLILVLMIITTRSTGDPQTRGGGGTLGIFLVGVCRWDPGTLSLYQS